MELIGTPGRGFDSWEFKTRLEDRLTELAGEVRGELLLTAFSGGPDSTALLHGLLSLKDKMGFGLAAAHLDHGLRGRAGESDREWCRTQSGLVDIPFFPTGPTAWPWPGPAGSPWRKRPGRPDTPS
ncbi:MAG: ATP-binding protein [Pseudomonadota bacterium]